MNQKTKAHANLTAFKHKLLNAVNTELEKKQTTKDKKHLKKYRQDIMNDLKPLATNYRIHTRKREGDFSIYQTRGGIAYPLVVEIPTLAHAKAYLVKLVGAPLAFNFDGDMTWDVVEVNS